MVEYVRSFWIVSQRDGMMKHGPSETINKPDRCRPAGARHENCWRDTPAGQNPLVPRCTHHHLLISDRSSKQQRCGLTKTKATSFSRQFRSLINNINSLHHVRQGKRKRRPRRQEVDHGFCQSWSSVSCRSYRTLPASRKVRDAHGSRSTRVSGRSIRVPLRRNFGAGWQCRA